jgi:hypothetical protein
MIIYLGFEVISFIFLPSKDVTSTVPSGNFSKRKKKYNFELISESEFSHNLLLELISKVNILLKVKKASSLQK